MLWESKSCPPDIMYTHAYFYIPMYILCVCVCCVCVRACVCVCMCVCAHDIVCIQMCMKKIICNWDPYAYAMSGKGTFSPSA